MRKSELNQDQITRRARIVSLLESFGWTNSDSANWFDRDVSFSNEIMMFYKNDSLNMELEYSFGSDELSLRLTALQDGKSVGVWLVPHTDQWMPTLEVINEFRLSVHSSNFRQLFQALLSVCPDAYTESHGAKFKLTIG